jgi:hypothetical protein
VGLGPVLLDAHWDQSNNFVTSYLAGRAIVIERLVEQCRSTRLAMICKPEESMFE